MSAIESTLPSSSVDSMGIARVIHEMFAIHILLCQGVSCILLYDAELVDGKGGKHSLRPQAHWPFRWHHCGSVDVKVGRRLVHRNVGQEIRMRDRLVVPPRGTDVFSRIAVLTLWIIGGDCRLYTLSG